MNKNYVLILFATLSVVSLAVITTGAIFLIVSCDGGCGDSSHGSSWPALLPICSEFYFPPTGSIFMIVVGGLGVFVSICVFVILQRRNKNKLKQGENL